MKMLRVLQKIKSFFYKSKNYFEKITKILGVQSDEIYMRLFSEVTIEILLL